MTAAVADAPKRVVLIDLSSIFHPCWRYSANQPQSMAVAATLDMVNRCAKKDPTALVAICLDSRKSWRKELVPSYKAQREKLGNDFYGTLDEVKARLVADGYLLWAAEGFEADDVIATACEEAVRRGHDVVICSADKDLMQLLRPGVRQFRTHDNSMWSEAEAEAKFGVKCSQLGDYLALVGDTSDNIKGCQGVGEKRASQMLQTNGDWPGIVKALEAGGNFTPAITAALQGFDYATTRKLIELVKDVPIKFDELYQRREQKPLVNLGDVPMNDSDLGGNGDNRGTSEAPMTIVGSDQSRGETPTEARETSVRDEGAAAGQPTSGTLPVHPENQPAAPGELPPPIAIGELVNMPKPEPTKALAPSNPALQPDSLSAAHWLAKAMYSSRLYSKLGNAEGVLAVIIRGKEMGFPALTSLDMFHVIQGRPCLSANAIQVLAERHPDCEYLRCVESTMTSATWVTKHRKHPEETRLTYTIEDAVLAGMATLEPAPPPPPGKDDKRGQWDKRRKEMVRKTPMVQLVRMVYPSAIIGLYAREELTDLDEEREAA